MGRIFVIATIVILLCLIYYLFPIIAVIGDSMHPTYKDGEIIVGRRLYRKSKLRVGDVILYKSPNEDRLVIKRIAIIKNGEFFYCLGDNSDCSYDSRNYGYISSKSLVCRVIKQRRK